MSSIGIGLVGGKAVHQLCFEAAVPMVNELVCRRVEIMRSLDRCRIPVQLSTSIVYD
jgi:hypothetical protein